MDFDDSSSTLQATPQSQGSERGLFQCGYCEKQYSRADHLTRHVRSHTYEKPFSCELCHKRFARRDLLKRHATTHDQAPGSVGSKHVRQDEPLPIGRVSQACRACALAKLKCEEQKPCRRCKERNLDCVSSSDRSLAVGDSDTHQSHQISNPSRSSLNDISRKDVNLHGQIPAAASCSAPENLSVSSHNMYEIATGHHVPDLALESFGVLELDGNFFPDFLHSIMIPPLADPFSADRPSYLNGTYDPIGFMDCVSEDTTDLDCFSIDYSNVIDDARSNSRPQEREGSRQQEADNALAIGAEAFRKSTLAKWTPYYREHCFAEQANFTIPADLVDNPEFQIQFGKQIIKERLSLPSRDQILAMVVNECRPTNVAKVVAAFPSSGILDSLIKSFFMWQSRQVDIWFHLPTICVNEQIEVLSAATAAAGAVRTSIPIFRRLGSALQETIVGALQKRIGNDNSQTRELQTLQSYALCLEIGLWSGNRRKIEVAEALSQPLVTMLRRARKFQRSAYNLDFPSIEDSNMEVQRKWYAWLEQEKMKRFVYHVFIHHAQASITLNVNPPISYAEMTLPLPASRELWEAKSATQWKNKLLGIGPVNRLPSLTDLMQDMSQLAQFQHHVDLQLSGLLLLYGLWQLIWEYHQLDSVSKGPGHWSRLILSSRHQELSQILQHFRLSLSDWLEQPVTQVLMVLELVLMHLYVSLEELQLYAGKEDKEAAKKVNDSARQWITTSASRQAVWHAGQVILRAKTFPPGQLRDFFAIAVYQASLAFWSYNVVARVQQSGPTATNISGSLTGNPDRGENVPMIWLDGADTAEVQKFITFRRGEPGISYMGESAPLTDSAKVMKLVRNILHSNDTDNFPPPMVESLSQLLHDLGQATVAWETE